MKSPQMMNPSGGYKQTGFTDEYCRMLIDQELAQVTIQKTLNTFRNLLQNRRTSISDEVKTGPLIPRVSAKRTAPGGS